MILSLNTFYLFNGNDIMLNSELLSTESVDILWSSYIEWLQIKYDFYKDIFWMSFIILVFGFVIYLFTRD